MSQVSYGTITITDTTDENIFIRYSANSNGSGYVLNPTSATKYVGIYIGTATEPPVYNDSGWKWSLYVGSNGLSVKNTRTLYYLNTGSSDAPQVTISTTIYTTDTANNWTSLNPTYVNNATYWTCLEVILSDNTTKSWSAPVKDLALTQAAKDNAEMKSIVQQTIEDAQGALSQAAAARYQAEALDAKLKYFFYPGDNNYPGVYAASGISGTTFNEESISTYGYNLALKPASLRIGYNNINAILLDGSNPSLKFYQPSKTTQATNPSMELSSISLIFYKIGTANKALELNSGGLNFYGSSTSTADATLTTNGLVLSKGGITAGQSNSNDFIYLSTESYGSSYTIQGVTQTDWKQIIGTNFGVRADGSMYATSGQIGGTTIDTNKFYSLIDGTGYSFKNSGEFSITGTEGSYIKMEKDASNNNSLSINLRQLTTNLGQIYGQDNIINVLELLKQQSDFLELWNEDTEYYYTNNGHTFTVEEFNNKYYYDANEFSDPYFLSTDNSPIEGKIYYIKVGEEYEEVENPTGNPSQQSYYEATAENWQTIEVSQLDQKNDEPIINKTNGLVYALGFVDDSGGGEQALNISSGREKDRSNILVDIDNLNFNIVNESDEKAMGITIDENQIVFFSDKGEDFNYSKTNRLFNTNTGFGFGRIKIYKFGNGLAIGAV